jgi:hypothetical protein
MEKYIELAKKLAALAEKGIGGERVNAQVMLEKIMQKHGLSIEDIEGEAQKEYFFTDVDQRLWHQIVGRVNPEIHCYGKIPAKYVKRVKLPGNYFIRCTASEYVQIEGMYAIYKRLYDEELNIFYHAFCTANDLLVRPKTPIGIDDLEAKELEKLLRVRKMSREIKTEQYRRALNGPA